MTDLQSGAWFASVPQSARVLVDGFEFVYLMQHGDGGQTGVLCPDYHFFPEGVGFDNLAWVQAFRRAHDGFSRWQQLIGMWITVITPEERPSEEMRRDGQGFLRVLKSFAEEGSVKIAADDTEVLRGLQTAVAHAQALIDRADNLDKVAQDRRRGYVYLLRSADGVYKIGCSRNPEDRRKTFEVKLPQRVEYLALIPTDNMRKLESELHSKYWRRRLEGEWFRLNDEEVAEIIARRAER